MSGRTDRRSVDRAADRLPGGVEATLDETQASQPWLGLPAAPTGPAVRVLGSRKLATQPVQLGLLVVGHADRRVHRRTGQMVTRPLRFVHRTGPFAAELQDLGAVDETLAAIGNEVGLAVAPAGKRRRPFLGSAIVEGLVAGLDDGAVDEPGDERRHLAGRDRDHRLIERRHPGGLLAPLDQRLTATESAEGADVGIVEAPAELIDTDEVILGGMGIAGDQLFQRLDEDQQASLGAIEIRFVEHALRPRVPPPGRGHLAAEHQGHREPDRAARRIGRKAGVQPGVMCAGPLRCTGDLVAEEVRRHRQPIEIIGARPRRLIRPRPAHRRVSPARRVASPAVAVDVVVVVMVVVVPSRAGHHRTIVTGRGVALSDRAVASASDQDAPGGEPSAAPRPGAAYRTAATPTRSR